MPSSRKTSPFNTKIMTDQVLLDTTLSFGYLGIHLLVIERMGDSCGDNGQDAVDPQLFSCHKYQKGSQNLNQHVQCDILQQ